MTEHRADLARFRCLVTVGSWQTLIKASAAVELVLQLAAREAVAARFKEIEPEHFFEALLKLPELRHEHLREICGADDLPGLEVERDMVGERLARRSVDATRVRCSLLPRI